MIRGFKFNSHRIQRDCMAPSRLDRRAMMHYVDRCKSTKKGYMPRRSNIVRCWRDMDASHNAQGMNYDGSKI